MPPNSMNMTPAQASEKEDLRLAPVLTVLWAGGDGADATAIGEAAKLVQAAARAAAERWPDGVPPDISKRIAHELQLIEELSYAPYLRVPVDREHRIRWIVNTHSS